MKDAVLEAFKAQAKLAMSEDDSAESREAIDKAGEAASTMLRDATAEQHKAMRDIFEELLREMAQENNFHGEIPVETVDAMFSMLKTLSLQEDPAVLENFQNNHPFPPLPELSVAAPQVASPTGLAPTASTSAPASATGEASTPGSSA